MGGINNVDYATLTVTNASIGLESGTPTLPTGARGAVITVETDQVRWRDDGTAPAADEGHLLNVGDVLTFDSWSVSKQNWRQVLRAIRFHRVTADAKLKISYYD